LTRTASIVLIAAGSGATIWSAKVTRNLTHDDDFKPLPVSPAAMRRTRFAGWALIALGALLAWYGPAAFQGPVDAVGF
jgi:hypothetical protein